MQDRPRGGPRGDILVILEVEEDSRFIRDGDDLIHLLPLSFSQAALGAEVEVPTVLGSEKIHAPAGTLIYIPANAPHTLVASPEDEDVIFIAIKDLSQGIIGRAVDGTMAGPHFEKGFGPKD